MGERRPFHESVVEVCLEIAREMRLAGLDQLEDELVFGIGDLLKCTIVPANHDAIIAAYRELADAARVNEEGISDVIESLEKEKHRAEEKQRKIDEYDPNDHEL